MVCFRASIDSIRYAHGLRIRLQIVGNLSPRRPDKVTLASLSALCKMLLVRVSGQTQLLRIAQRAYVGARGNRIFRPLSARLRRVTNGDMRDGLVRLIPPFDTGCGVDLGVGVWADKGVEERIDRKCGGRVS